MSHKFLKYTLILLLLAFSPYQIILHVASVLMLAFFFNKIKPVYAYEDYTHWGLTSIAIYRLKGASKMVRHPRLVATPHIGAQTHEAQQRAAEQVARLVLKALQA